MPMIFLDDYDLPLKQWIAHNLDKGRKELLFKHPHETEQEFKNEVGYRTIIDGMAMCFYVN